ncbi:MAG TPA: hypothetical protein VGX21_14615 [Methylomirabilota bacterium]|jgi:hypothetical protein|nr:hypothetical protein [Methylomirabilota bacterium]
MYAPEGGCYTPSHRAPWRWPCPRPTMLHIVELLDEAYAAADLGGAA